MMDKTSLTIPPGPDEESEYDKDMEEILGGLGCMPWRLRWQVVETGDEGDQEHEDRSGADAAGENKDPSGRKPKTST